MTDDEVIVHLAGLLAAALILGLPAVIHGIRLLRRESAEELVGDDTPRFGFDPMPEPISSPLAKLLLRWKYHSFRARSRRAENDATS